MLYKHTVTYELTEGQEAMLRALTERYNKVMNRDGMANHSADELLASMMTLGCAHIIKERMDMMAEALDRIEARGGAGA